MTVLEQLENWSRVRTEDGQVGYLPNRRLKETEARTLVSTFQEPEYTSISMDEPVVLVWHQVTNLSANQAMQTLISATKGVNVIAPTWFMLTDNNGNYESLADKNYVDQAHALGMQVWAVLDNFNKGDNVQSEVLFASTAARKKLIASLMKDARPTDLTASTWMWRNQGFRGTSLCTVYPGTFCGLQKGRPGLIH